MHPDLLTELECLRTAFADQVDVLLAYTLRLQRVIDKLDAPDLKVANADLPPISSFRGALKDLEATDET